MKINIFPSIIYFCSIDPLNILRSLRQFFIHSYAIRCPMLLSCSRTFFITICTRSLKRCSSNFCHLPFQRETYFFLFSLPNFRYTLRNQNGMKVDVLSLGGIITSIRVPDKHGSLTDVVLGYDIVSGKWWTFQLRLMILIDHHMFPFLVEHNEMLAYNYKGYALGFGRGTVVLVYVFSSDHGYRKCCIFP